MTRNWRQFFNPLRSANARVLGINARNRLLVYRKNPRRYFPLADDKLLTKEILVEHGIPVPRTLHVFSWMHELKHVQRTLGPFTDFVVKPSKGQAGSGILVIVGRDEGGWLDTSGGHWPASRLARHIGDIVFGNFAHGNDDRAIVEERLVQAPLLNRDLFPGLPDIRVITLDGRVLLAMLRLPTSDSGGKANLHQGAIGVGVDCTTGDVIHAVSMGKPCLVHPDTGTKLSGVTIHEWPAIISLATRVAAVFPLGYLGIDIAMAADRGPVVLEINVRPGLEIQNANLQGMKRFCLVGTDSGAQA